MSKFIANSFQVPNAFIDEMLFKLSGNACKIYLLIVRKTRGWHKEADRISYSQIQKYTGINHRATISKALDELLELGLIFVQKGNEKSMSEYRLNDDLTGSKNEPVKNCTSSKNEPTGSKNEQEAGSKNEHTEIQYIKNTNTKDKSDYDTHTHENQNFENSQNSSQTKPTTKNSTSVNSKSKKSKDYLTVDDLMNLKLSDFKFTDKDFKDYPNLGDWIFENMDYQIAKDYLAMRTNKLTMTAIKSSVKQASIAGLDLSQALEVCITYGKNGWQTFKADWYFNAQKAPAWQPTQPTNRMDELRHMANTNPTNVFVDDLPPNFHALGANHE